jgi:hypothetical protein
MPLWLAAAAVGGYCAAVQLARRRRRRELERIGSEQELVLHLVNRDFAFLWNKSLEFGGRS